MEPSSSSSSSNSAMEPKHRNEEIFQKFMYAYLLEKGYQVTAEVFRNDTQLTEPLIDPNEPPGFLLEFWNSFYPVYNSRSRLPMEQTSPQNQFIVQQPCNSSMQRQVRVRQPRNSSMQSQVMVQQPGNSSMQSQVMVQQPRNSSMQSQVMVQQPRNSRARLHMEQTFPQNQVMVQQPRNSSMQTQIMVQQPRNSSMQSQVIVQPLNNGHIINTTNAQIIWDQTPIQHHSSFRSVAASLLSCDISSDGNIVASGGRGEHGMKPFICYTGTSHSVITQDTHKRIITEVRFKPDFNLFATGSADASIKLWDATTPQKVLRCMEHKGLKHKGAVRSLDFYPLDNKTLCSSDNDEIKVWDLNKYTEANSFKESGKVVRFQPVDGSLLAVANENGITIFDYHNLFVAMKLQGHVGDIKSLCWDVTGKMIASVSEDEVRVWSVNEGRCIHSHASNGRKFQSVIFHPRCPMALVIGGFQCLLFLNLENMMEYTTPSATELSITGLATKAQSQFFVTASDDSVVKIWK